MRLASILHLAQRISCGFTDVAVVSRACAIRRSPTLPPPTPSCAGSVADLITGPSRTDTCAQRPGQAWRAHRSVARQDRGAHTTPRWGFQSTRGTFSSKVVAQSPFTDSDGQHLHRATVDVQPTEAGIAPNDGEIPRPASSVSSIIPLPPACTLECRHGQPRAGRCSNRCRNRRTGGHRGRPPDLVETRVGRSAQPARMRCAAARDDRRNRAIVLGVGGLRRSAFTTGTEQLQRRHHVHLRIARGRDRAGCHQIASVHHHRGNRC